MPLKIAITGASGSGKSMLINTFRGLSPGKNEQFMKIYIWYPFFPKDDIGAAELGTTETTIEIQRYAHPKYKNLKFYDLPVRNSASSNIFKVQLVRSFHLVQI